MLSAPGDRVITGAQLRDARDWLDATAPMPADCAGRVLAVLGHLVANPEGWIDPADLAAALTEPDTVECALTLLDDAGLPCG